MNSSSCDDLKSQIDRHCMSRALELAAQAGAAGEVPVGAVVASAAGEIIGEGWNQPITSCDPSAHAEIVALRQAAAKTGNYRLPGATLYVSIEPCTMCAGALLHSRIERLVIAALEPKAGAVISQSQVLDAPFCNHRVQYEHGLLADRSAQIMSAFFQRRREEKRNAKTAAAVRNQQDP